VLGASECSTPDFPLSGSPPTRGREPSPPGSGTVPVRTTIDTVDAGRPSVPFAAPRATIPAIPATGVAGRWFVGTGSTWVLTIATDARR